MFIEFFEWFCNCLTSVFDTMKKFTLFEGFTYFNFFIALLAIPIIVKLFKFIMGIEDEEANIQPSCNYISQYDGYVPRHGKKKRGWF